MIGNYGVTFFGSDGFLQPILDRRKVTFGPSSREPPLEFIREHFRQAVLANIRGTGQRALCEDKHRPDALTLARLERGWLDVRRAEPTVPQYDEDESELFIGCNLRSAQAQRPGELGRYSVGLPI